MSRRKPSSDRPTAHPTVPPPGGDTSAEYVLQWNRLVSRTNWEKGRILCQWRQALIDAGAPPSAYSDEAWSRQVGSVSSQHVGRLRRTYERFGENHEQFAGLYWSHFCAALEWDDAEMWLEGAVHNGWSISQMRQARQETLNLVDDAAPAADFEPDEETVADHVRPAPSATAPRVGEVTDPRIPADDEEDYVELPETDQADAAPHGDVPADGVWEQPSAAAEAPFESLEDLPDDLAEACEAFKLAIVRHRMDGWKKCSRRQVLQVLDALRKLALANDQ